MGEFNAFVRFIKVSFSVRDVPSQAGKLVPKTYGLMAVPAALILKEILPLIAWGLFCVSDGMVSAAELFCPMVSEINKIVKIEMNKIKRQVRIVMPPFLQKRIDKIMGIQEFSSWGG